MDVPDQIRRINSRLDGWANYYRLGAVTKAYKVIDRYTRDRLRQWLRRKFQLPNRGTGMFPIQDLYTQLGLVRLDQRVACLPWAKT